MKLSNEQLQNYIKWHDATIATVPMDKAADMARELLELREANKRTDEKVSNWKQIVDYDKRLAAAEKVVEATSNYIESRGTGREDAFGELMWISLEAYDKVVKG